MRSRNGSWLARFGLESCSDPREVSMLLEQDWCGLAWTDWIPFDAPTGEFQAVPTGPGLYRVRVQGQPVFAYIGQTGRSLRERLGDLRRNTHAREMPFNDPPMRSRRHPPEPTGAPGGQQSATSFGSIESRLVSPLSAISGAHILSTRSRAIAQQATEDTVSKTEKSIPPSHRVLRHYR